MERGGVGEGGGVCGDAPHFAPPRPTVDKYIAMAKDKHGYNIEQVAARRWGGCPTPPHPPNTPPPPPCAPPAPPPQALGMLLWHKHDVEKSLADLANFTPFPDEWSLEDKVLFEQAFSFHGKSFARIQQMVRTPPTIPSPFHTATPPPTPGPTADPHPYPFQTNPYNPNPPTKPGAPQLSP